MHSSRGIQIAMFVLAAILLAAVVLSNEISKHDSEYIFLVAIIIIVGACIMEPLIQIGKKLGSDTVINVNNYIPDNVKVDVDIEGKDNNKDQEDG